MKYTALLPHPVRWTSSTFCRSATRRTTTSSWSSRKVLSGRPVRRRRSPSASSSMEMVMAAPYEEGVTVTVARVGRRPPRR
jgi:hypothetical protein